MSATVLFVDDEVRILAAIKRMLRQENYKKIFVSRAIEALEIIEKEPVQVLVTDLRMPEMDGLALIRKVKEKKPEIVCIILTAYSQVPTLLAAINQGDVFRYLTKPWNSEEDFKKVIQEAIACYEQQEEQKNLIKRLTLQTRAMRNTLERYEKRLKNYHQQHKIILHHFTTYIEPAFKKLISEKNLKEYTEIKQQFEEFKRLLTSQEFSQ
ncbi:MAG: response regulator [Candidatus Desulfofervidus auxilii]|nr:response regulator [Candidatus Desulfofervidus auxilii]